MTKVMDELKAVLGMTESTGIVLTSPTMLGVKETIKAAREMPLDEVLKHLGVFVADVLANDLQTKGHRPANYANVKDLGKKIRARLVTFLTDEEQSKPFEDAFVDQMKNRG